MHGMCTNGHGCCNCQELTPEQEKEQLGHLREMLEKKLDWVKEKESKMAGQK